MSAPTAPPTGRSRIAPAPPGGPDGRPAAAAQPAHTPRQRSAFGAAAGAVRSVFAGTPGSLRLLGLVGVIACLLFGVVAFIGAQARSGALGDARSAADQLVRVQTVQNNMVLADANLTSGFLGGGLEPPVERTAYADGIAAASSALAKASGADDRDATQLGKVNEVIGQYTGLVEGARANNRQGFPIGTAYLRQATTLLRSDALPVLDTLAGTEQQRVSDAYDASATAAAWLWAGVIGATLVLLGVLGYLAVRTRRLVNLPIAVAAVIVIGLGIAGAAVMSLAQGRANDARDGAYLATVRVATARTDGFDARSAEALTLINRGSGQAYEARFKVLAANATGILSAAAGAGGGDEASMRSAFATYLARHTGVRRLDDGGNWDKAVVEATGAQGRAAFTAFDAASGKALDARAGQLRDELGKARSPLQPLGIVVLIGGALAAAACWWGISIRLREYQ